MELIRYKRLRRQVYFVLFGIMLGLNSEMKAQNGEANGNIGVGGNYSHSADAAIRSYSVTPKISLFIHKQIIMGVALPLGQLKSKALNLTQNMAGFGIYNRLFWGQRTVRPFLESGYYLVHFSNFFKTREKNRQSSFWQWSGGISVGLTNQISGEVLLVLQNKDFKNALLSSSQEKIGLAWGLFYTFGKR